MTRINCIPVEYLTDKHLVAEYREMLRLRHLKLTDVPVSYRMGKGHIKFFADKGLYLINRHDLLCQEMKCRGYVVNYSLDLSSWGNKRIKDWRPGVDDKLINIGRILNRLVY